MEEKEKWRKREKASPGSIANMAREETSKPEAEGQERGEGGAHVCDMDVERGAGALAAAHHRC